jgi:hypothetical protein
LSILLRLNGDMTLAEMRQAFFEMTGQLEDEHGVHHTCNASLFINPVNEAGEKIVVRDSLGAVLKNVTRKGAYRCAADDYNI